MTRRLDISARQITAICRGAAKAGFVAELVINGAVVRLTPEAKATSVRSDGDDDDRSSGESPRDRPIPKELQEHYDKLGYDPATMDGTDYSRLYQVALEKWRASIPALPLNQREEKVLLQFQKYGPNVVVPWREIKGTGVETGERLKARGFLDVRYIARSPDRLEGYVLTEVGFEALKKLLAKIDS